MKKKFIPLSFAFFIFSLMILQSISCGKKVDKNDLFNLEWTKYYPNPVFLADHQGWDGDQVLVGTILKEGKIFRMWYYGTDNSRRYRIGLAESPDGIVWNKSIRVPVLLPSRGTAWDSHQVSRPCVLPIEDGYRMWYVGERREGKELVPRLGLAISSDGVNWTKYEQNPVFDIRTFNLPWAHYLRYFWILRDENQYKMWFSAVGKNPPYQNVESIGYAYSPDGIKWQVRESPVFERDTSSVWEDFYVSNPFVLKKANRYYLFYGGLGRFGYLFKENIGMAVSYDGIFWNRHPDNPIVVYSDRSTEWDREFVTQPRVIEYDDDTYYLWYVGADKKNTLDSLGTYQIGLAIGKFKK